MEKLKQKSRKLKKEVTAVYIACKKPELPWYTRLLGILIIGYALSPIDLIPDFIPVLGYLDDLILIPAGLALLIRLIPGPLLDKCRSEAEDVFAGSRPKNWTAGIIIILLWVLVLLYFGSRLLKLFG